MGLEIISGVERRRRWSAADKLRIVAEADEPGAKVAEVARRHEISRSILWTWRKQARAGELTASDPLGFLAVVFDMACCRFGGHEDKIVTHEPESGYDETEVQPRVQD